MSNINKVIAETFGWRCPYSGILCEKWNCKHCEIEEFERLIARDDYAGLFIKIKLPPITKKNSQQIRVNHKTGARFIAPSAKFTEYQNNAGFFIKAAGAYSGEYPANVKCLFYMPTKRRVDLVNLLESVDDILTHYGVVADDSAEYIGGHDGSRVLYDKLNPRTEIIISKLEDDETI